MKSATISGLLAEIIRYVSPEVHRLAVQGIGTPLRRRQAVQARDIIAEVLDNIGEYDHRDYFDEENVILIDALALLNEALKRHPLAGERLHQAAAKLAEFELIGGAAW